MRLLQSISGKGEKHKLTCLREDAYWALGVNCEEKETGTFCLLPLLQVLEIWGW